MKVGDMVRFALWDDVNTSDTSTWSKTPKRHIGILLEHDKLMGWAEILYRGEVHKIRACFVEKSGRKDNTTKETTSWS